MNNHNFKDYSNKAPNGVPNIKLSESQTLQVSSQEPLFITSSAGTVKQENVSDANTITTSKSKQHQTEDVCNKPDMPINSYVTRIVTKTVKGDSQNTNKDVTESVEKVLETVHPIAQSSLTQHGFLLPLAKRTFHWENVQ